MRLKNGRVDVFIDLENGGRISSLKYDRQELMVTSGAGATEWGCYPMAPWAGRVRGGQFKWEGQMVSLPQRLPPHALHGTVLDRRWTRIGDAIIETEFGDDWPWKGRIRSHFSIVEDTLTWTMDVLSEQASMPVVCGWHPWLRRRLDCGAMAQLSFAAKSMYVRDADGIATNTRSVTGIGPWDDCFTEVTQGPLVEWSNGLYVKIQSSCTHWVVYTMPEDALCVEPQSGPPDAFNLGGAETVRPGRPLRHTMGLSFGSKRPVLD